MKLVSLVPGPLASLGERLIQLFASLESLLLLGLRLYIANIFWKSGLVKITSWETTLDLFKYEYKTQEFIPFLSAELAAISSTVVELICPLFLAIGLATRFSAIPLLVMTAVIQYTYLPLELHYFWAMLLAVIIIIGPGRVGLDASVRASYDGTNVPEIWKNLTALYLLALVGFLYWRDGETIMKAIGFYPE